MKPTIVFVVAIALLGCGQPSPPAAPAISAEQMLRFETIYSGARKLHELKSLQAGAPDTNDADKRELNQQVHKLKEWIGDFERARDARDEAALLRCVQEMRAMMQVMKKFELDSARPSK